jgi:hypothetical protein
MKWVLLVALFASAGAQAQARGACKDDADKLCPHVRPEGGLLASCLEKHAANLSADCKAHLAEMPADSTRVRDACQADARKICADVTPGEGRLRACLAQRADRLSKACREALFDPAPAPHEPVDDCQADAARWCRGISAGDGRLLRCLADHRDELTQACSHQTEQIRTAVDDLDKACERDVETVCKGVVPGQGNLLTCLKDHVNQLSPACRALIKR